MNARPPQMIQKSDRYPPIRDDDDQAPYYHDLKRVQESVVGVYPNFPLQANKDFFVSQTIVLNLACFSPSLCISSCIGQ